MGFVVQYSEVVLEVHLHIPDHLITLIKPR